MTKQLIGTNHSHIKDFFLKSPRWTSIYASGAYRRVAIVIHKIVGILLQSRIPKKFMDPQLQLELAGHIEDFALEVLDGLIHIPQGTYRRVGP
ncbi:hypothetical protein BY996DRAFT_6463476 [Phakopsora pachyrhizi]|nr:hypothetical protein BY996DRAFT_6463476 [Phakopsora pachyrhizi]